MSTPFSIDCVGHKINLTMINDDDSLAAVDITVPVLSAVLEFLLKTKNARAYLERDDGKTTEFFLISASSVEGVPQ